MTDRQRKKPRRLQDSGDYSISYLAELFAVSRPMVYRTLHRQAGRAVANSTLGCRVHKPATLNSATERRSSVPFSDKSYNYVANESRGRLHGRTGLRLTGNNA